MSDPNTNRPAAAPSATPPLVDPSGAPASGAHAEHGSSAAAASDDRAAVERDAGAGSGAGSADADADAGAIAEQHEANRQNAERLAENRAQTDRLQEDQVEANQVEANRDDANHDDAGGARDDRERGDRFGATSTDAASSGVARTDTARTDTASTGAASTGAVGTGGRTDDASPEPHYAAPLPAAALSTEPDPIASRREYDTLADDVAATRVQPTAQPTTVLPTTVLSSERQGQGQDEGQPQTPTQTPPSEQRVFVRPPLEPKRRGNRGVGSIIAIASVLVFATVFAIIGAIIILIGVPDQELGTILLRFIGSPTFFVPALFFVVGFVLLVLLLNRANWWTYIIGSLFVAALVYFGTIGVRILADNIVTMTPDDAARRFAAYAANPFVVASAFAAREVAMWFGAIIAARGRRVKVANNTAREQHALASEQYRAEFERGYTPGV